MSGLAAARLLAGATPVAGGIDYRDRAERVVLLEASERLGGKVLTTAFAGGPVDLGPDQFLRRDPSTERLCRLLGLGDDLVAPGTGTAAVFTSGRPRQLPSGLVLGIPTDLAALRASGLVSEAAVEYARGDSKRRGPVLAASDAGFGDSGSLTLPSSERSAGAILRARLGDEIVDRLIDPLIGGINAGSLDNLSLGIVAPQVARALVGHRDVIAPLAASASAPSRGGPSPFIGIAGGLSRLVRGIEDELRQLGCDVRLSCPALRIRPANLRSGFVVETPEAEVESDAVVVALPARPAASVLRDLAPEASEHLGTIDYASVATVTFAFDRPMPSALAGWSGILVPRVEGTLTTALSLLSQKWPWMSKESGGSSLVRVSAGRHLDTRVDSLSDNALCRVLAGELAQVSGMTAEPTKCLVQRWTEAFPQYAPGFSALVCALRRALGSRPGIELAGAALGGIGIPACITSGERAAEAVRGALGRS